MTPEIMPPLLLRLLPSIIVAALGFVAATQPAMREQWAQLLYLAGSVRRERRQDLKVQRSIRGPFLFLALLLLAWPISYFRHATRVIEISPTAYGTKLAAPSPYGGQPAGSATNSATAGGTVANSATSPSTSAAPAATPAPAFNPYGASPARP